MTRRQVVLAGAVALAFAPSVHAACVGDGNTPLAQALSRTVLCPGFASFGLATASTQVRSTGVEIELRLPVGPHLDVFVDPKGPAVPTMGPMLAAIAEAFNAPARVTVSVFGPDRIDGVWITFIKARGAKTVHIISAGVPHAAAIGKVVTTIIPVP